MRQLFRRFFRSVSHQVSTKPQFDRKLRRINVFRDDRNYLLAHSDRRTELEEEVWLVQILWLNERHEHVTCALRSLVGCRGAKNEAVTRLRKSLG